MIKKIDWFTTLLALISIIIAIISFLAQGYELTEYLERNKVFISTIILPLFLILYIFFAIKAVHLIKASRRIYVSYSHVDKNLADYIINYIGKSPRIKHNRMVVLSDNNIKYGEDISHRIKKDISSAGTVILIVSAAYMDSVSCRDELLYIIAERPKIIPLFLSPVNNISEAVPQLQNYKGAFLKHDSEEDLNVQLDEIIKDITD